MEPPALLARVSSLQVTANIQAGGLMLKLALQRSKEPPLPLTLPERGRFDVDSAEQKLTFFSLQLACRRPGKQLSN